jgi:hypothetical protein
VKAKRNGNQQDDGKGQGGMLGDVLGASSAPGVGAEDDFNPRASEKSVSLPVGEFGDFTSAFGKPAISKAR